MAQCHSYHILLVKLVAGQPNSRVQRNRLPLSVGGQHVYSEEREAMAAILGDKLPQMGRGSNPQNEDARTRRESKEI